MIDLIERLRSKSPYLDGSSAERVMAEAADEIEALRLVATSHEPEALRLQAEIERLRAALDAIAGNKVESRAKLEAIARRALETKP